jgi:predicted SnoaL-like aldol condensation-catalyzing enzyme
VFDLLCNKRDDAAVEKHWSPNYIQHSAYISMGREGLFDPIGSLPPTLKYEPGMIVAGSSIGTLFRVKQHRAVEKWAAHIRKHISETHLG